ncbi:hypothetical protein, partial [Actinoplanes philippinensis]|uniref:hypothetical protein n=1 Tax=Actinoplanes philippinensis TaxID=35752 RepID=UPI0033E8CA38
TIGRTTGTCRKSATICISRLSAVTEWSDAGFRTAVRVLRRPAGGLRWVVIPTIHVGHPDYYWAIWQRLRSCQAVVAEQYDGPSSTGYAFATAMRLTRQRASRELVHQDIDYGALGVPVVFPDAHTAPPPEDDRRMPDRGWADVIVSTPGLALRMALSGRDDWLAGQCLDVDDTTEFAPMPGEVLGPDGLTERDRLLLGVIREIDEAFAVEDIEVAVVFGAAHMPLVVRELTGTLGHRPFAEEEWLTAIDFDEPPYLRKPSLDGWMDW